MSRPGPSRGLRASPFRAKTSLLSRSLSSHQAPLEAIVALLGVESTARDDYLSSSRITFVHAVEIGKNIEGFDFEGLLQPTLRLAAQRSTASSLVSSLVAEEVTNDARDGVPVASATSIIG